MACNQGTINEILTCDVSKMLAVKIQLAVHRLHPREAAVVNKQLTCGCQPDHAV